MHEPQTTATEVPVCLSVCHAASLDFGVKKVAERIEVLFALKSLGGHREHRVRRGRGPSWQGGWGSAFSTAFAKLLWPFVGHLTLECSVLTLLKPSYCYVLSVWQGGSQLVPKSTR